MWQKCWSTNQNLIHHLRFRERGPLKSWRPETMADAIMSVLKDGLSLSQAARKYDIPYPTFVLYANRVHNMLGPSIDGGSDLRPKGRGRPQRILLGVWPEDHIKCVVKTVVFRDDKELREEVQIPEFDANTVSIRAEFPLFSFFSFSFERPIYMLFISPEIAIEMLLPQTFNDFRFGYFLCLFSQYFHFQMRNSTFRLERQVMEGWLVYS